MIQFKYNDAMRRYDVLVPFTINEESETMVVAYITENNRIALHREVSLKLMKQIVINWDEYEHQITRESDELLINIIKNNNNKNKKGDK